MLRILHCFNWELENVISNADNIANTGYNAVQVGPLQPLKTEDDKWFWLYQPCDLSIGNRLGTKEELIELRKVMNSKGVKVIVDVVSRHVAGDERDFLKVSSKVVSKLQNPEFYLPPIEATTSENASEDRNAMINKCHGMPTFNLKVEELIDYIYLFLREVLLCSDGFRLDAGKHFGLPEEGYELFWNAISRLREEFPNAIMYLECINCPSHLIHRYSELMQPLQCFYENTVASNSVVFFESHDTFLTWGYTRCWIDDSRYHSWQQCIKNHDAIYFARPPYHDPQTGVFTWDNTIFSERMRNINLSK